MSLIACTFNYKIPFLIGDLLISSKEKTEEISLPTGNIVDSYLSPDNPLRPIALNQKAYITKDNVCVALAGDVDEMAEFLAELRMHCRYYQVMKEEDIRKFIDGYGLEENFTNSAFFISLVEPDENNLSSVKQFWYPPRLWDYEKSEIFEAAFACGSGKKTFLSQLNEKAIEVATTEKGDIRRAIAMNIGFITRLIAIEKMTLGTILQNWGGGFEIIFHNGKSFEKVSEFAVVIINCSLSNDGDISPPVPSLILYYRYHNDILFVTSLEIKGMKGEEENGIMVMSSRNFSTRIYLVLPIDRKEPLSQRDVVMDFSFYTNEISLGYVVTKSNGNNIYPSCYADSLNIEVTFKQGEIVEIKMPTVIHDMIGEGIKGNRTIL